MKQLNIGMLAHVDAGKTTLSEAVLYTAGSIRKLGRVDNQDAFLDHDAMERNRGITIFSKQASFDWEDGRITLLDTPGHVDFSAEMERTLQVLDYAILVVSGADGVQSHTETLWRLLEQYQVPVFLFVNKMDRQETDPAAIMRELQERLSDSCTDFGTDENTIWEASAMCEEGLLEEFLEEGKISDSEVARLIRSRKLFPCYFGAALKLQGVKELLQGFWRYSVEPDYAEQFGAKVYKITRDSQGNRLTHLKVTGGTLQVRQMLSGKVRSGRKSGAQEAEKESWEEKVNQIRLYSGERYETVSEVSAGMICTVTGLNHTYPGGGLGVEAESDMPVMEPVMTYQIILPEGWDPGRAMPFLRELEEEIPELHIIWNETLKEIQVQMMGEVQIEILREILWERYRLEVTLGAGSIVYKETIAEPVIGMGHFEPLRHYAEVHLLLEPGEPGSGLEFAAECSEDLLDKNWQRLILTHLEEREHRGVLTGAAITDMRISVIAGKAHQKHTEGGDFRQATYRAVRQGLMKAKSVLLEPYYAYHLEVPMEQTGRAMTDLERMQGTMEPPETTGEMAVLTGEVPVSAMREYQKELTAYTGGRGHLSCSLCGYRPCHNAEEVIQRIGYDAETDLVQPADSVFCAHGSGFVVGWDQAEEYMHVQSGYDLEEEGKKQRLVQEAYEVMSAARCRRQGDLTDYALGEEEIQSLLGQAGGANRSQKKNWKTQRKRTISEGRQESDQRSPTRKKSAEKYLLVDGYNIVFAWEELKELARENIDAARGRLMDIMCNYQGYCHCTLILVFDAYKVKGNIGQMLDYHNIHVVYTKEAETADQYIEKLAHKIGREYDVTVATSDGLEQLIIRGQGCKLWSAREFLEEVRRVEERIANETDRTY